MKNIKKIIIITVIILLIIPLSISIYMGNRKPQVSDPDVVIMESNNAEKLRLNSIRDESTKVFTYSTIFASLILMGCLYFFVASKKE